MLQQLLCLEISVQHAVNDVGTKTDYMRTLCLVIEEVLDFARCTIVGHDDEAFVIHVKNEILTLYARLRRDR